MKIKDNKKRLKKFWGKVDEKHVKLIEEWVIAEFAKIGLDTARSILKQDVADLARRTDLEEETIQDVMNILKDEFED